MARPDGPASASFLTGSVLTTDLDFATYFAGPEILSEPVAWNGPPRQPSIGTAVKHLRERKHN